MKVRNEHHSHTQKYRAKRAVPIASAVCLLLLLALNATAQQTVTIDWSNPNPTPAGAPSSIYGSTTLLVKVINVNDILYQYTVNAAVSTAPTDDLANLLKILKPTPDTKAGAGPCDGFNQQLADLEDQIKRNQDLNAAKTDSTYASIPLSKSLAGWRKLKPLEAITAILEKAPKPSTGQKSCPEILDDQKPPAFTPVYNAIQALDARANGAHETQPQTCTLAPGQQCIITVYEYYIGLGQIDPKAPPAQLNASTTSSGKTFTITPGSSILTLSAGFMATTLASRTYTATAVPGDSSPVLTVGNNSGLRPAGVALLNYALPKLDSYQAGLALSAGPVITFGGGGADVSTLGFFTGISVHLWHRLYLSPGFHFGQFADFPAGFVPGQFVPANVGTPAAVNRWTSRFAFGITFQTTDFSRLVGGSSTSTKTAPAPAGPSITVPTKARQ